MSQRDLSPIVIILLITGVIGGYLVYSGKTPLSIKNTLPVSSTSKIEDWKVYTDEVNGFSFKYPSNWIGQEKAYDGGYGDFMSFSQDQIMQLQVTVSSSQTFEQLKELLKLTEPETSILGKRALKYETGIYILLDDSPNKTLHIQKLIYPDEEKYLDKILSTLKFTN